MTKSQLIALRDDKLNTMNTLVESRAAVEVEMTETDVAAVKTLQEEIRSYDKKIEAIDILQTEMAKKSNPVETEKDVTEESRAAFGEYLRGTIDQKEYEVRANVIGTPAKGGTTVPDEFFRELQESIKEFGIISGKCRHITTADNGTLTIPTIDDTANSGVWTDEMGAIVPKDFATGKLEMNAYKITTAISVSTELLDDAFFSVESYIAKQMGQRIARTVEKSLINGDGVKKPEGVLVNADTVDVPTAAAGKVDLTDLTDLITAIQPSQRNGAEFIVSDALFSVMLKAVDGNGRPLLQPNAASTQSNSVPTYSWLGYGVTINYDMDATVATGKVVALFGNMNSYIIRDVRGLTVKRDDYTGMSTDSVSFYATMRLDGKVINVNKAFAKLTVK